MLSAVLTSVLPVCLLLSLGAALCRVRFLPEAFFASLNRLGFWVLLPSLLFCTISQAPAAAGRAGLRIGLLLCVCAAAVTVLAWAAARLLALPPPSARALMQAAMRGNLAYTALPVIIYAFGEHAQASAAATFALAPTIPFYNFLAVLILTRPEGGGRTHLLLRTAAAVARNPLILGCAFGLLVRAAGWPFPVPLLKTVEALGRAALPCALLALGSDLTPERLRTNLRPASAATLLKLVCMPLLGLAIGRMVKMDGESLLIALLFLASPSAVTSYVMADQMGADKSLAGSAIALSTLLCLPVMALILVLFG